MASPLSQKVTVGEVALIKCIAEGHARARFSWFGPDGFKLPQKGHGLVINSVQLEDAGNYTCRVKTAYGESFAVAELVVLPPPTCEAAVPDVFIPYENVTVYLNTTGIFEAALCTNYSSLLNLRILRKVALHAAYHYKKAQHLADRLNAIQVLDSLNVINASALLGGKIVKRLFELQQAINNTNLVALDLKIDVSLLINVTDLPFQSALNRSAAIAEAIEILNGTHHHGVFLPAPDSCPSYKEVFNNTLFLPCEAEGAQILFYHNGMLVNQGQPHFRYTSYGLQVLNLNPAHAGNYTCVAVNGCASNSATAFVNITGKLYFNLCFLCSCRSNLACALFI